MSTPSPEVLNAMRIELTLAMSRANHLGHDVHHARLQEGVHWLAAVEREQHRLDRVAPLQARTIQYTDEAMEDWTSPAGAGLGWRSEDGSP